MTHPFQSIIDTQCDEDAHDEWYASMELRADEERAERAALAELRADDIGAHDELRAFSAQAHKKLDGQVANTVADDLFNVPEPGSLSQGGVYTPEEALARLNSRYFIGKGKQETAVFRLNVDGSTTFVAPEQFKLEVQNILVEITVKASSGDSTKKIPAEKFWKEHPDRRELEIVFKPKGVTRPNQYNLWRGFGAARGVIRCPRARFGRGN